MAWPKMFTKDDDEKKEEVVANPEKKQEEKKADEKTPAELIAEALKPVTEGFATMRAEIDALKVKTTPKEKQEVASVLEDEDAAFAQRMSPIMGKQLELEARIAKDDVEKEYRKNGYGELWDENRKDIDDFLAQTQLVTQNSKGEVVPLRGNPEYIRNIADMMIGRAARKGGVKFDGKDKKFFLEDTTGDGTIVVKREKPTEGITKKQLDAAKRFGIPIEKYRDAMSKLHYVDRN